MTISQLLLRATAGKGEKTKFPVKLVVLILLSPFICLHMLRYRAVILPIDFQADLWKSNVSLRLNMEHNLLTKNRVIGLTQAELERLLGSPDGDPWKEEFDSNTLFYRLQQGDLVKTGKYIELIGFQIKNNKVDRVVYGLEKYW